MNQNKFYEILPVISGDIVMKSTLDRSVKPFRVISLVYTFERWLGDDIVTAVGGFIVTERLRKKLEEFSGTGYIFEKARVTKSDQFEFFSSREPDKYPKLPKFHWLKITGKAGEDDFGLHENWDLVVPEAALEVLKSCQLLHAEIKAYSPSTPMK